MCYIISHLCKRSVFLGLLDSFQKLIYAAEEGIEGADELAPDDHFHSFKLLLGYIYLVFSCVEIVKRLLVENKTHSVCLVAVFLQRFGSGQDKRVQVLCGLSEDVHSVSITLCYVLDIPEGIYNIVEYILVAAKLSCRIGDIDTKFFECIESISCSALSRLHTADKPFKRCLEGLGRYIDKLGSVVETLEFLC